MSNTILKECKHHGLTEFAFREKGTRTRCKKCASDAVSKRRRKVKQKAVEYCGRECADCGLESDIASLYDFHHKDPEEKDFAISARGHCRSWAKVQEELDKCVMLCANCHRIRHHNENIQNNSRL